MDIKGKSVLILGGWGLVGFAIARRIIVENPSRMIIASLQEWEAKEAVENLSKEFPDFPKENLIPWWGNIFLREEWKDQNKIELLKNPEIRKILIDDILEELNDDILKSQSLYQLISKYKPSIIIDSINTATGIAYQNIYSVGREVKKAIKSKNLENIIEQTERLLATLYIPQLIRHVQILYKSMEEAKTQLYIKIGTSGTGGMGLNIPYTHSEEKPSRVLLSKSSVAGAHTLLLFLLARTPNAPITKEIKPTAAIAWKKIGFGEIKKGGKPVELLDHNPDFAIEMAPLNLCDVVKDIQKSCIHLAKEKNVQIISSVPEYPCAVFGDYGRIRQLVMIIADNAIKFSPENGTVKIVLEEKPDGYELSIEDNGKGISEQDLPYVFERFYKTKSPENKNGTGLGLAIAKEIALRHGARLFAQSNEKSNKTVFTAIFKKCPQNLLEGN